MFSMMVVCIKKMLYKYNAGSQYGLVKYTRILQRRCGLSCIKPGCSYSPRFDDEGVVTFEAASKVYECIPIFPFKCAKSWK